MTTNRVRAVRRSRHSNAQYRRALRFARGWLLQRGWPRDRMNPIGRWW